MSDSQGAINWALAIGLVLSVVCFWLAIARIRRLQAEVDQLRRKVDQPSAVISHNEARRRAGFPAITDTEPPANT